MCLTRSTTAAGSYQSSYQRKSPPAAAPPTQHQPKCQPTRLLLQDGNTRGEEVGGARSMRAHKLSLKRVRPPSEMCWQEQARSKAPRPGQWPAGALKTLGAAVVMGEGAGRIRKNRGLAEVTGLASKIARAHSKREGGWAQHPNRYEATTGRREGQGGRAINSVLQRARTIGSSVQWRGGAGRGGAGCALRGGVVSGGKPPPLPRKLCRAPRSTRHAARRSAGRPRAIVFCRGAGGEACAGKGG